MKPIVLLSGAVGAGKTTVAKELIAISPGPISYIEGDIFWNFFAKGMNTEGRHRDFKTVMTSMVLAAVPFAMAEYEAIVDFSIPPWYLPSALKIAARRTIPVDFVVIRPSLQTCAARAAAREEGRIEDYTFFEDLYKDFNASPKSIICEEEMTAEEIAALIRQGLDGGKFRIN